MSDDGPPQVGQPIDVASLARGADGAAPVPGTALRVLAVPARRSFVEVAGEADGRAGGAADAGAWIVLLEGHLLIDLPYGDFRELQPGHALELPDGADAVLDPVEPSVVLIGRRDRAPSATQRDVS